LVADKCDNRPTSSILLLCKSYVYRGWSIPTQHLVPLPDGSPLSPWSREHGFIAIGKEWLAKNHLASLLSRRDDERRLVFDTPS
jgi:hypothetical protein